MSVYQPDQNSLSYSARFCPRCGASMSPRRGLFNRVAWRCTECKPRNARKPVVARP